MEIKRFFYHNFIGYALAIVVIVIMITIAISEYMVNQKYEESAKENITYVAGVLNSNFLELKNLSNYLATNTSVQKRMFTEYDEKSQHLFMYDDKEVDILLAMLGTFKIVQQTKNIYLSGNEQAKTPYIYKLTDLDVVELLGEMELPDGHYFLELYELVDNRKDQENDTLGDVTLRFRRKIKEAYGDQIGILFFELNLSYLQNFLDLGMDKISHYTLVDSNNTILYDDDFALIGTEYVRQNTEEFLFNHENLVDFGLQLYSVTKKPNLFEQPNYVFASVFVAIALILILALCLIRSLYLSIIAPILDLSDAMIKVREEDMDVQIKVKGHGEVAQLLVDFNVMVNRLKTSKELEIENIKKMKDAEYKILQVQINPHFMYNALNTVKHIAIINKQDNIAEMIQNIWVLLKNASHVKGDAVTLAKEMEIIKAFVHLQEIRYKGKFIVEYEIHEELMECIVPKYILQPIVENAIFHGIAPKKGLGTITIRSELLDNIWKIAVIDDGVGMTKDRIEKIKNQTNAETSNKGLNNIGMRNVIERMHLLYKDENAVEIESGVDKGTKIVLEFPL